MCELAQGGQFAGFRSDPQGPIKDVWWNSKWIPITYNDQGDHLCIDLDPEEGGIAGQVIDWWHERGATHVVATNVAEWLGLVVSDLQQARFRPNSPHW
jgi:cell wall assembly regulator SMI1